jgi:hypothetical protein
MVNPSCANLSAKTAKIRAVFSLQPGNDRQHLRVHCKSLADVIFSALKCIHKTQVEGVDLELAEKVG